MVMSNTCITDRKASASLGEIGKIGIKGIAHSSDAPGQTMSRARPRRRGRARDINARS